MYDQHALIVDDSKTAQLRLKRMLQAYELEIDVVSSAEEALAYLSYRVPAVIFLDQSMQGMDGIEALRTIKANPSTATIPVIMYTSEQGAIFTGQARALGALDILYKSTLKPSSLEQVLRTLKIPTRKPEKAKAAAAEQPAAPARPAPIAAGAKFQRDADPLTRADLDEIRGQIARLFEIHIADVARQITKSTQFLAKRFAVTAENAAPDANDESPSHHSPRRWLTVSNGVMAALVVALLGLSVVLLNLQSRLRLLSEDYATLAAAAEMNSAQMTQLSRELYRTNPAANSPPAVDAQTLNLLTWAASADFAFDTDEGPLSERMVSKLEQLIYQLDDTGFQGVIELNLNFGNTCLAQADSGEWLLAPPELPAYDCVFRAALNDEFGVNNYLSRAYLSFEQRSPVLREGTITLVVGSRGLDSPRHPYPPVSGTITAGDWNDIALRNNYLSFAFHPLQ